MATQDALHQKQEDLTLVVEPLVDSISELVLAAVTQSYENIQKCCLDISERTNKLVLIAQQVATASTDVDLQIEVANAINGIAAAIEKLVVGFTAILTNTNPKTQEEFAAAARDVGEAINKLVAATDQTSQRKIMVAVKEALESAKQVQECAFRGKDALLQAAQMNVDKTVRLVKAANLAAGATADEKKKNMFLDGANSVKALSPKLIQAAKTVMENPQDQNSKNDLDSVIREITSAFTILLSAAKLSPSYFGKLNETFEYVKKLIEMARSLEEEVSNLYTAVQSGTQQQFLESAKLTASKAIALAEQAEAAMKMETDPVRRQIIKDAIAELREASSAMIKASKAYRENPTPENKAELDRCYQRLEASIKAVIAASGKEIEDSPKGRLEMASTALENASKAVLRSAEKRSAEDLAADSEMLAAIALQYAKDAEAVANEISDPIKRKAILDNAQGTACMYETYSQAIRELSQKIIAAAKKVLANPNDAQAKKELEELHAQLAQRITAVKRAANMIPGSDEDLNVNTLSFALDGKSPEAQLIQAANEGALAALQLATEAEKRADAITDPTKKKQFQDAIAHVKLCSKKVLAAAEALAANPYDPVLQKNLADAQKELDDAVHKVVQLSSQSTKDENELADAMAEMKISSDTKNLATSNSNAIKMAEEVMKDIAALFGDPNRKLKPEEVIAGAKQLSAKASELAKQLREMAEKTTDPVFKEKLLQSAKIIRDGSVQIKILSAVRAAGGEDKSNSVAMSAKGLDTNIKEILKLVNAEMLKNRFRATVKQTIAINKVVNVWKSKAKK